MSIGSKRFYLQHSKFVGFYAQSGCFWRKFHFFWKSQKIALYCRHNLRINELFGNFWCKNTIGYWAKKSKSCSICRRFMRKITFFGIKVNKVPCIIVAIWGKINFLGIFGVKNTMDYWAKKSKWCSICRRILRKKSLFLGEKLIKCPVL